MDAINKIRKEFADLKELKQAIENLFGSLSQKIEQLQSSYVSFMEKTSTQDSNFGIDSLHFQRRYLLEEHNGMKTMFKMINNQIYKDYYKLYKLVTSYVQESIKDRKVRDACQQRHEFPVYKDLEHYKEYPFEDVIELHHDLVHVIVELLGHTNSREREWLANDGQAKHGLNIDNYVTTGKFENQLVQGRTNMFIEYLEVFHSFHLRYLSRFSAKLRMMYTQVQRDIKIDVGTGSDSRQSPQAKQSVEDAFVPSKIGSRRDSVLAECMNFVDMNDVPTTSPKLRIEIEEFIGNQGQTSAFKESQQDKFIEKQTINEAQRSTGDLESVASFVETASVDDTKSIKSYKSDATDLTDEQRNWQKHNRERAERRRLVREAEKAASVASSRSSVKSEGCMSNKSESQANITPVRLTPIIIPPNDRMSASSVSSGDGNQAL
jgi:hypothetical protein